MLDWIYNFFSMFLKLPLWEFFVITFFILWIAFECGTLLGKKHRISKGQEDRAPITSIVTATLALLGFLLAFTYGMAGTNFDIRRALLVSEANALNTAYLRSEYLPEAYANEIKDILREYVSFRFDVFSPEKIAMSVKKSEALQNKVWKKTVELAKKDPNSVTLGLFIEAVNEFIVLHNKRFNYRVRFNLPVIVWLYLYFVTFLAVISLGYYFGVAKVHFLGVSIILILTFSTVLMLIADLDRPDEGYFRVSQEPLNDLKKQFDPDFEV